MVYVDPKNLGYEPYWKKWLAARSNKQERGWLSQLYEKYVPPTIDMIIEGIVDGRQGEKMKTITPLTNLNLVNQTVE
jgi:dynein heavy chain